MPKTNAPTEQELHTLLQPDLLTAWDDLTQMIELRYSMSKVWHTANKGKSYELKYRKAEKTLVSLFPRFPDEEKIGVMVIFGAKEREKFETIKANFSPETIRLYDEAKTFHDGKWVMFYAPSDELLKDLPQMLAIKRKPENEGVKCCKSSLTFLSQTATTAGSISLGTNRGKHKDK